MEELNAIIQGAIDSTGGGTPPSTAAAPAPPVIEQGSATPAGETPAQAAQPFEEGFDYTSLPAEQQEAYRFWHGNYTKKRQADAERIREMEARAGQYEGVPDEAVQIARDYANRLAGGDVAGAEQLLTQQLQALQMLKASQGYGYQEPAGYSPDPYATQDPYGQEAPDPVMQRLQELERRQQMFQVSQEFNLLQTRLGRALSPLEQQRMIQVKQANPGLNMEQVYFLTNRDTILQQEREKARADALQRFTAAAQSPSPPAGVAGREAAQSVPTDRLGIIREALRQVGG